MKYLFCKVLGDEHHDELTTCVVPLSAEYVAWLRSIAEDVAEFSDHMDAMVGVMVRDCEPRWYGTYAPFPWKELIPFEDWSIGPEDEVCPGYDSLTEQGVMEGEYCILDLPDNFKLPDGERTECDRLVVSKDGHELFWQAYPKHGSHLYKAMSVSSDIFTEEPTPA